MYVLISNNKILRKEAKLMDLLDWAREIKEEVEVCKMLLPNTYDEEVMSRNFYTKASEHGNSYLIRSKRSL